MKKPEIIKEYDDLELKLGIKSSLPGAKSAIALMVLLWESNDCPAKIVYGEEESSAFIPNSEIIKRINSKIGNIKSINIDDIRCNPLYTSQIEALKVAFELIWKLAKFEFLNKELPFSAERTGGKRYIKEIHYTCFMDLISLSFSEDLTELYKVLLGWLGLFEEYDKKIESRFVKLLTIVSEFSIFKMSNNGIDITFNQNGIYNIINDEKDEVDLNADIEAKGTLRILKSLLKDGLNYYLKYNNINRSVSINGVKIKDLESYRERVDSLLSLIPRNTKIYEEIEYMDNKNINNEFTPEWFKEKSKNFPNLDNEANNYLKEFSLSFSPDKLSKLSGKELLNYIFINNDNKTSLCNILEYDATCKKLFGSIKSGTAYKYGLHYSKKNNTWATGTSLNPKFISEKDAIILGTRIRDNLLNGYKTIKVKQNILSVKDYQDLYEELLKTTDGYIDRVWFVKYYAMLLPNYFVPIYSKPAQYSVIDKLNLKVEYDNKISRIGVIREFVRKCDISNVMFNRIFWTFCNIGDEDEENDENEEEDCIVDIFEIKRNKIENKKMPLNLIVYGAPGTSKTYNMPNYAIAAIDNAKVNFKQDRVSLLKRYKELLKSGQIVFTTFHQNYGYEDFIEGLRPDPNSSQLSFKTIDGVFKKIADKAIKDNENSYVIIIDEINRGNISKIFGELITLIEEDKRWGEENEMSATLPSGRQFAVPNNLYIIGTMNSADKSISLIDAALRRRFDFEEMTPDASLITDETLRKIFIDLNTCLYKALDSSDLLIGHSYFINKETKDLEQIMNNRIIPLLYEYFYDNKTKIKKILEDVFGDNYVDISDQGFGRLRFKNKLSK